jgi:hypothetical protein
MTFLGLFRARGGSFQSALPPFTQEIERGEGKLGDLQIVCRSPPSENFFDPLGFPFPEQPACLLFRQAACEVFLVGFEDGGRSKLLDEEREEVQERLPHDGRNSCCILDSLSEVDEEWGHLPGSGIPMILDFGITKHAKK